jgi:predicted MFS family arabinose efflux permease
LALHVLRFRRDWSSLAGLARGVLSLAASGAFGFACAARRNSTMQRPDHVVSAELTIGDPPAPNPAAVSALAYTPLWLLALGAFAVGTEGFMIAATLPRISADLDVSIAKVGQLVTIFALTYALSSPVLTTLTGGVDRRKLLIASMAAFSLANLLAAAAPGYWSLVGARILLAFAAGIYVPNANALASVLAPAERRARAIAIVNGGLTLAIAFGVPLGAVVGTRFGWRMTFVGVAGLASVAIAGLAIRLPRGIGNGMSASSLKERLDVVRAPRILPALLVTTIWALGGYTVYTFIAPFLALATGITGSQVGWVLFVWGACAGLGLFIGGTASDRFGSRAVISACLPILALALISLSGSAHFLLPATALAPVVLAVSVWGVSAWSFYPAQQARLIAMTGVKVAPIILSLNASFMYFGFSLGAALGSFTLLESTAANLGCVGGACELAAFALFCLIRGRRQARDEHK